MTAYPGQTRTTLGQLCAALWGSQSRLVDASRTEMQCVRPLCHLEAQTIQCKQLRFYEDDLRHIGLCWLSRLLLNGESSPVNAENTEVLYLLSPQLVLGNRTQGNWVPHQETHNCNKCCIRDLHCMDRHLWQSVWPCFVSVVHAMTAGWSFNMAQAVNTIHTGQTKQRFTPIFFFLL
jgi:hypothetical protein